MTMKSVWKSVLGIGVVGSLLVSSFLPGTAAGKKAAAGKPAYDIGFQTFEPTLGAAANGDLYFSTTPSSGVALGWSASIAKSQDGGRSWKDVGPQLASGETNPPETNDPYIYVDPCNQPHLHLSHGADPDLFGHVLFGRRRQFMAGEPSRL
ncbi:MAG TPA: hypothetical protein VEV82_03900 [Actinomycetota bacterium]|nr:hypothetical protein [Actinomycetota bacterium]